MTLEKIALEKYYDPENVPALKVVARRFLVIVLSSAVLSVAVVPISAGLVSNFKLDSIVNIWPGFRILETYCDLNGCPVEPRLISLVYLLHTAIFVTIAATCLMLAILSSNPNETTFSKKPIKHYAIMLAMPIVIIGMFGLTNFGFNEPSLSINYVYNNPAYLFYLTICGLMFSGANVIILSIKQNGHLMVKNGKVSHL